MIREVNSQDAVAITRIYNEYIKNSVITFEEDIVACDEMKKRIEEITQKFPYFVVEEEGQVLGYAYASTFRKRVAYDQSVEISLYLHKDSFGKGYGSALMERLINACKEVNIHCLIGCITLPNDRSVALHEKYGFEKVAHFKEVGYKFKQYLDVGFWQLLI